LLIWFLFCATSGGPVYFMLRKKPGRRRLIIGYLCGASLTLFLTALLCLGSEARHASATGSLAGTGVALALLGPFMVIPYARNARRKALSSASQQSG